MPASTAHLRKKRFQPSLDSYFERRPGPAPRTDSRSTTPRLSEETQASLISVGMRVRKSVPEGYKTHKTFAQPVDEGPILTSSSQQISSTRELAPFCGLHKTGGLSQQEWSSSAPPALGGQVLAYDMSSTGSSEFDSISSSVSIYTYSMERPMPPVNKPSHKRSYSEEMEEAMDEYWAQVELEDNMQDLEEARRVIASRVIARPKGRVTVQQRNLLDGDNDFEEACFLQSEDHAMADPD